MVHRPEAHPPLKPLTYSILLVLQEREDYGYGIAKRVAEPAAGGIRVAPSNLYHVLDRLVDEGLLEVSPTRDEDDARRTYYRVTAHGAEVFREETRRLSALLRSAGTLGTTTGSP